MKKILSLYGMFLLIQNCLADIPLDKNGNNKTAISDFNFLPLVLGVLFAAGIMVFIYILNKEKDAVK
jgi:hypothetical protein